MAGYSDIRAGGQVQRHGRGSYYHLLRHLRAGAVDFHGEAPGKFHVRARIHADCSAERASQPLGLRHQESRPTADGDSGRTPAAQLHREIGCRNTNKGLPARRGELLDREIATQRLAEDGQRKAVAFHA